MKNTRWDVLVVAATFTVLGLHRDELLEDRRGLEHARSLGEGQAPTQIAEPGHTLR